MGRKKNLSEEDKLLIARVYKNRDLSIGAISKLLGFSRHTIVNYKDYKGKENND